MNKTLDLHGIRHEEVDRLIENFILLNEPPLTIITGNSDFMKARVRNKCREFNFHCEQWTNQGEYKIL